MRFRVHGNPLGYNGVKRGPTEVPYGSSGVLLNLLNCKRISNPLDLKSRFLICWFNIMIITPRLLATSE